MATSGDVAASGTEAGGSVISNGSFVLSEVDAISSGWNFGTTLSTGCTEGTPADSGAAVSEGVRDFANARPISGPMLALRSCTSTGLPGMTTGCDVEAELVVELRFFCCSKRPMRFATL